MYGFPMGAVPVDKESLRFMCAWSLIKENEEAALDALDIQKRAEQSKLSTTPPKDQKEQTLKFDEIGRIFGKKEKDIRRKFREKGRVLMRHAAGPLAKFCE
jgi:hypothetical protein